MTKVTVSASKNYDILIGSGLLDSAGSFAAGVHKPCSTVIISDSVVAPLYLSRVQASFDAAGFSTRSFVFPNGEASKSIETLSSILEFLAESALSRTDLVVALGGGVTGDITGFAAAVYQRGISFIQIPTTLLSAVDSSVGGKTAVNLAAGKNLAGAFYQPKLVLCDTDTLATLPENIFQEGMAEVIKYSMLADGPELLPVLTADCKDRLETVITSCVSQKRDLVQQDEFDNGLRRFLNLGHTIGHAVELCSNFMISHGAAVAIGMAVITRSCVKRGICSAECYQSLETLLEAYHLPLTCGYSAEELHTAALRDKKHANGSLTIVIPSSFGSCALLEVSDAELLDIIRDGLGGTI